MKKTIRKKCKSRRLGILPTIRLILPTLVHYSLPCIALFVYTCLVFLQNLLATLQEAGRIFTHAFLCALGALTRVSRVFLGSNNNTQGAGIEDAEKLKREISAILQPYTHSFSNPFLKDDEDDAGYDSAVEEFLFSFD